MPVEDTTKRDPLLHHIGMLDGVDPYITDMEAEGQRQLIHSNLLPTDMHGGSDDDLTALGIQLGPVDANDPLFREATLPAGWTKEPTQSAQASYVKDPLGRVRLHVYYKAAFYDRNASVVVLDVAAYAWRVVQGEEPVVLDDKWATRHSVIEAVHHIRERAEVNRNRIDDPDSDILARLTKRIARCDELLTQLTNAFL